MKKKFVNTNGKIFYGDEAELLLRNKNDIRFVSKDGIVKVDEQRWKEAQLYEKSEWMDRATNYTDDRNEYHMQQFDNYNVLSGHVFESAIELGCGPFTNMRLIKNTCDIKQLSLLDPLMESYINHPGQQISKLNAKAMYSLPCEAELWVMERKYDLIVMINVLEHVYNVPKIFANIHNALLPGGIFVFSDVAWKSETIKKMAGTMYNAGHPIRLEENYLNAELDGYKQLYYKLVNDYNGDINPIGDIYFIGQKP